jgi:PAS domain S-box-containing protein
VGMALASTDGRWLKANSALCALLGYDEGELLERRMIDVTHADDQATIRVLLEQMLAGTIPSYQAAARLWHRDGHPVPVQLNGSVVRDLNGAAAYTITQLIPQNLAALHTTEPCPLTDRERQVLSHLANGSTTSETAEALRIGRHTVTTYCRRAATKLGARTRTHAVAKALSAGWLSVAMAGW